MTCLRAFTVIASLLLVLPSLGCTVDDSEHASSNGDTNGAANNATPENASPGSNQDPGGGNNQTPDNQQDDRPDPNNGDDFNWDDEDFQIDAVVPPRGPLKGGTEVRVTGHDLVEGTELRFGTQRVDTELSQGQLVATTPPGDSLGPVAVRAISPGGAISELPNGYTYADPTSIDDWFPSVAPSTGGVEITLIGSGFSEPLGLSFGDQSAATIDRVNDEQIRAKLPPLPPGSTDIVLTTADERVEVSDALTIFDPIAITHVAPTTGHPDGGDTIDIEATGLTADTQVRIGDQSASIDAIDPDAGTISITTPAGDPGTADIRLLNDYAIARIADGYLYTTEVDTGLHAVSPSRAATDGSSTHVLSGTGLDAPGISVHVAGSPATILNASAHFIEFEAPSNPPGPATVEVLDDSQPVDALDDGLYYLDPIAIDALSPSSGDTAGGDTLTLSGQGLDQIQELYLGARSASFEIIDDSTLEVTTPAAQPGPVDLRAVDDTGQDHHLEDAFVYTAEPQIWGFTPTRGSVAGNTFVTLHGKGLADAQSLSLDGEEGTDLRSADPFSLTFRTPAVSSSGERELTVHTSDDQAQGPYPFVYFNPLSSFGGASGPPVEGSLNISVVDPTGSPVPQAFVMLSTNPDTEFQGFTDANGQLTLSGPGLQGPQMVTATAAGLSAFTIRELDAENLTIQLGPIEPADGDPGGEIDPPPYAQFYGDVTVTGKGSDPERGALEINHSRVRVTRTAVGAGGFQPGSDANVDGEGSYQLISRVGDLALVAFCGYLDDDDHFTPKFLGVERYIAAANEDVTEVDLHCEHRIDASLPIKFNDPIYDPEGPHQQRVQTHLDFGFEGVIEMPEDIQSYDTIVDGGPVPRLEGQLEDLQFIVQAGSFTDGNAIPYSETTLRGIDTTDQLRSTHPLIAIPYLTNPADGELVDGHLQWIHQGANAPDLQVFQIHNDFGLPAWTLVAPGEATYLPMPQLPSFDDLSPDDRPDPYISGNLFTTAEGARIPDFNYNHFTFGHLSGDQWRGHSLDQRTLRLR